MPSRLRSLLLRITGSEGLRPAEGALVASLILIPVNVAWAGFVAYAIEHSVFYVDRDVLAMALRVLTRIILPGWVAMAGAALWVRRRRPDSRLLAHVVVQFYVAQFVFFSYLLGLYTDLYGAMALFAGTAIGLLLFEPRVVRAGVVAFAVLVAASTVAEQLGWIPYAPAFATRPVAGGHLATSWLVTGAGLNALILMGVALFLVAAMQLARERQQRLLSATDLIRRYVPAQLAERILSGEHAEGVPPERRKLTLFFSDVAGFPEAADRMQPEELSALLNEYLSEMSAIANSFGATVNQFTGDGIMIFFGAPEATDDRDHALRGVRMALAMQRRMGELRRRWLQRGIETPFGIRIGINTGVASVGDFGSEGTTTYSAIGNQTNLTARIQAHCEPGRVLVSHATWALVKDEIPLHERGEIEVRGLHYPVRVYTTPDGATELQDVGPPPAAPEAAGQGGPASVLSWLASFLRRAAASPDLPLADGVVATAGIMIPVSLSYALMEHYALAHPDFAPYFDRAVLGTAYQVMIRVLLPCWVGVLLLGLLARRRWPENRPLAHAAGQLYMISVAGSSYAAGHYTEIYGAMSLFGGTAMGLLFFDARIVRMGIVSFVAIVASTTLAEQLGWIPYGPWFADSPIQDGHLATSVLLLQGGFGYGILLLVAFLFIAATQLAREQEQRLRRATALIRRYVPAQLAERILSGQYGETRKPERRNVTIFFSDVAGFTSAADQMEPEDLAAVLNEYLGEMASIASRFGASVNQFMGDGIMIFFGAPEPMDDRDQAVRAVRMAQAMQQRMGELSRKWFEEGIQAPFRIRIGINTGEASVGDFGSEGRIAYAAIGNQTHLTARIQALCEPGGVLISQTTWALVRDEIACRERGEIASNGLPEAVPIYEVAASDSRRRA